MQPGPLGLPLALWLFLGAQAAIWISMPSILYSAPELNTVEIAMWGREWFWVNYKHPALPSWAMQAADWLFGFHLWVPFLVSQIFISTTLIFVFLLGRDLFGRDPQGSGRALIGTLLLAGVTGFTLASLKFNHNVAQLPFWAAFCFGLWRASESDKLVWWCFTAAVAALGLYAKFSTAMLIAFGTLWIAVDPLTSSALRGRKPYIALGLFCLMLAPLCWELVQIDFLPFTWMRHESAEKGVSTSRFIYGQVVACGGALILAAVVGVIKLPWLGRGLDLRSGPQSSLTTMVSPARDPRRFRYLLLLGAGPLLLTFAMSGFAKMRVDWTMPMFNLLGLLLVATCLRRQVTALLIRHVLQLMLCLSLVLAAGVAASTLYNRYEGTDPARSLWPMAAIGRRFETIWEGRVGRPLRIVGGEHWVSSLIGLPSLSEPALFNELDAGLAPTMTPQRVRQDGVLVVWRADGGWQPSAALLAQYPAGTESFPWSANPARKPIVIDYLIIPPQSQ